MNRRIAANLIKTPTGIVQQAVIELVDGYVSQIYPLIAEQSHTEWIRGMVEIKQCADGKLIAFYGTRKLV